MRISKCIIFCGALLVGCIQEIEVFEKSIPYLVVDGVVDNQPGGQHVRIYYTAAYNTKIILDNVLGADVKILDDLGNEETLVYRDNGFFYSSEDFLPTVGRSYRLLISLESGHQYQSSWELMRPVPPIEDIRYEVRDDQVFFMIDFNDTNGTENYYRWRYRGTYSVLAELTGMICYIQDFDHEFLRIESDLLFKGKQLQNFYVFSKSVDIKFNRGYYMDVQQFSLSKEAYGYWLAIEEQKGNNGTIFETSNYQIRGNISSTVNEEELVLGFFGASAVYRIPIAIDNFIGRFIPFPCKGYEPPQQAPLRCSDCRVTAGSATTKKPDFWPF